MKWALLAFGVVVWPCQCTNAGAPEVCGASLTAEGATLVYGANFQTDGLAVHVEGTTAKGTEGNEGELRGSRQRVLRGEAGLPKAPDASAKTWKKVEHFEENILLCDAGGEASSRPAEVKVLFVKNAHGVSPPLVMNRPEIWGVSARQPSPGEDLFVWGVNLGAKFALASPSGEVLILCGYQAYNPHSHRPEGRFMKGMVIPDGLKPGRHRLFNWGGHGDAGWSEAFDLEIVERPNAPTAMLKLADFGAVGDGLTDDTAAFLKAFEAAQAAGGGRIHVPPGRYVLSQSLLMPEGVGLFGVSRELTTLLASPSKQLGYPKPRRGLEVLMIQLASNCTLSDLTLDVTGAPTPTQNAVMIHIPGGDRVTLNRLALVDKKGGPYGEYPDFRVWSGVVVTGSTQDLVVERCLFSTSGVPFSCWPSHNVGGRIRYNTFTTSDPHLAFELFMPRTLDSCLIEGNKFVNGGRAKTEQTHVVPYPSYRNCWVHNVFENNRKGDGEILMHETGGVVWFGQAAEGDATRVRAANAQWKPTKPEARPGAKDTGFEGYTLVVTQGKGVGQFRRIASNTADTLTVDKPWRVIPDVSSTIAILWGGVVECLFIGNDYFYSHYYTGIYGSGVRNVWVNEVYESVGGGTFLWPIHGPRVMALNLIYGSKFNERAGVVVTNDRRPGEQPTYPLDAYQRLQKCVGNEVRGCSFRERSYVSTENGQIWARSMRYHWARYGRSSPINPLPGAEAAIAVWDTTQWAGYPEEPELDNLPPSTRWNLLAENFIVRCPVGIQVGKAVERTILSGNVFLECGQPVKDLGRSTVNLDDFVAEKR